jgi:glycosyltransferase involved in cell wall biosynthesis
MRRVAVVVQRCHESVVGGSEALAWQYASLLARRFEVEVLTSTATDYVTWANALEAGVEVRDGVAVRRFPVAFERGAYWHALHQRMNAEAFPEMMAGRKAPLREALQDEYVRFQGPYCPALDAWLQHRHGDYAAIVFCTYLYPTTYSGIAQVPAAKAILVPTLHNEPTAYLPVFARRYASRTNRIWLTRAEQRIAERVWRFGEGEVLGMAVDPVQAAQPEARAKPYFLYCGRVDPSKGCDDLVQAMQRLPSHDRVSLVLTGVDVMGLPSVPWIEFLGFVDDERKRALMAGALAFVLPSEYESFSIVTLEAMAQGTPVIVNARSEVMRDHVELSNGGFHYDGVDELVHRLEQLVATIPAERRRVGAAGRRYVLERYREEHLAERLIGIVERVASSPGTDGA